MLVYNDALGFCDVIREFDFDGEQHYILKRHDNHIYVGISTDSVEVVED